MSFFSPDPNRRAQKAPQPPPSPPRAAVSSSVLSPGLPQGTELIAGLARLRQRLQQHSSDLAMLRGNTSAGGRLLPSIAPATLELLDLLAGSGAQSGPGEVKRAEIARDRGIQVHKMLQDLRSIIEVLHPEPFLLVLRCLVADFSQRLKKANVVIGHPHSQTAIASCLEESRLMIVFAGAALRSEEHIQSALSGIKGKSFAGDSGSRGPKETSALDSGARQEAFAQRQAAKAAAADARKAALRDGGALPVKSGKPVVVKDEFKSELLESTAKDYAALCASARPTEEQKRTLREWSPPELESRLSSRLTKPKGPERQAELDEVRRSLVNECARIFKAWMEQELSLAETAGATAFDQSKVPSDLQQAKERGDRLSQAHASLAAALKEVETDSRHLAEIAEKLGATLQPALPKAMVDRLNLILHPPEEKEIYEIDNS